MSMTYWGQWNYSEILSMQGVELDECNDDTNDCEDEIYEIEDEIDLCQRCFGCGCNYCLMVDW